MSRLTLITAALVVCAACSKPPQPEAAAADPSPAPVAEAPKKTEVPVPDVTVSTDPKVIAEGQELFAAKGCIGCHKVGGGKLVGPDLKGVTARRDQKWVSKMILAPDVMTKEDDVARQLLATHMVQMPNQGVDPSKELPLLLAYLKSQEK
jgi:mono/diheme cytochrome c family protein